MPSYSAEYKQQVISKQRGPWDQIPSRPANEGVHLGPYFRQFCGRNPAFVACLTRDPIQAFYLVGQNRARPLAWMLQLSSLMEAYSQRLVPGIDDLQAGMLEIDQIGRDQRQAVRQSGSGQQAVDGWHRAAGCGAEPSPGIGNMRIHRQHPPGEESGELNLKPIEQAGLARI